MKPIKVVDGTAVQLKSQTTKSVDVHLQDISQYVNIILPDEAILVIEPDGTVTRYEEDNLIGEHRIKSLKEQHNEALSKSRNDAYTIDLAHSGKGSN